jgi:hypothetical protein
MAKTKYGHMIKKLKFEKGKSGAKGTASPDYRAGMEGKDLEGIKLLFGWGYLSQAGVWGPAQAHTNPAGEILLFTGLDYGHPGELWAEIEEGMGPEDEKHVFNTPAIISPPPGFPHGPLVIRRVDRPFAYLGIYLDSEFRQQTYQRPKLPPAAEKKYGDLVKKMEFRDLTQRPMGGNADYIASWNGKDIEGFKLNFTFAFHKDTGPWHGGKDPHVHSYDEALLFVGCDPERPEYLGAEIQIEMGKEREVHVFDYPAVVVAPAGFVHCPLVTRKVGKPYIFSAICLNVTHDTTWLGTGKFPWEQ